MNASDFYELQIMHVELLNNHLEIWIGFTFAILVAFHLLGRRLNLLFLLLVEFLYTLGSYFFVTRYLHTSSVLMDFNARLVDAGHLPYPMPHGSMFLALSVLFIVGTLGTMAYGIYSYRNRNRAT